MTISSADRKYLRQLGHQLKPIVTVARNGLNDNVLLEIDRALCDHELIKVKVVVGDREAKQRLIGDICEHCNAQLIQSIGHIALIYRKAEKPNPRLSNLLRQ